MSGGGISDRSGTPVLCRPLLVRTSYTPGSQRLELRSCLTLLVQAAQVRWPPVPRLLRKHEPLVVASLAPGERNPLGVPGLRPTALCSRWLGGHGDGGPCVRLSVNQREGESTSAVTHRGLVCRGLGRRAVRRVEE